MKHLFLPIFVLAFAGPVFAQSTLEKTGINSLIGVAPKTKDFVHEAATSDVLEVESSKLAIERADEATKVFAKEMVAAHEKTAAELKGLVTSGKVMAPVPTALSSAQQEMLGQLKRLHGEDFTKQYRSDQEEAHEDAVDLFKRYSEGGDNAEVKSWAAATLPALEHHLEMARELNK